MKFRLGCRGMEWYEAVIQGGILVYQVILVGNH